MIKHILLYTVLALAAHSLQAVELSFIRGPLEKSASADPNAGGTVRSQFVNNYARMYANLRGLTPDTAYQLTVDGTVEADFVADTAGHADVQFRITPTGSQFALDFDPRGKEIAITDGTNVVLSMIYSGPGEPSSLMVDERTTLVRAETVASGRVEARYLDQKNKSRFILHFLGLDRGVYTLRVAGEDVATVDLSKGRSAMVRFESNKFGAMKNGNSHGAGRKNKYTLEFDPRGELIEVVAEDQSVAFSGVMLAQIAGLPVDTDDTITLTSTGADSDATGSMLVTTDDAGETKLTISVEQLTAGDYQVWIGGANRGTINVADDGTGATSGQIVFATLTEGTDVPLDFPLTGTVEIKQGATVYLTGSLD
jgi:hypothetical protein